MNKIIYTYSSQTTINENHLIFNWGGSSNFSIFLSILQRINEEENKNISFIARWLRMLKTNLQLWNNREGVHKQKDIEAIINIKNKNRYN